MARIVKPLTDKEISNAKLKEKQYGLFDGGGLYLEISPNGSKLWRMKYRLTPSDEPIEEEPMLLRKQALLPKTRKHFGIFSDPFGDEIRSHEDMFMNPDTAAKPGSTGCNQKPWTETERHWKR